MKALSKKRVDEALVERGILSSRSEAKRFILEGKVMLNGSVVLKANKQVSEKDDLSLKEPKKFVGRGGIKLEHALNKFRVDVSGKITADIGVSTGGFTDCLLKRGAKKVYAVDVGYGQIDLSLRNDPRVVLLEKTNARYLTEKEIPEKVEIVAMDVSFISITKILPALYGITTEQVKIVSLVKPQFEGKPEYLKKGIVKSKEHHLAILKELFSNVVRLGYSVRDITYSPIKGGKGNIEYFFLLEKSGKSAGHTKIEEIVREAWNKL